MNDKDDWHQRTKFITIERPLLPPPPLDAVRHEWFLSDHLAFYDAEGKKVWEQEIPEAGISWVPSDKDHTLDEFHLYFWHFEVFKDGHFGWQLRFSISHRSADYWYDQMMAYLKECYRLHFEPSSPAGGAS
jgi:hypothetical protein